MKANLKFWFLVCALLFFACFPTSSHSATLSAPERAEAGRLTTVKSNVCGDWMVYPPDSADIAKDSDEMTLYVVAHRDGAMTVIFFGVENGKAAITQTTIQIGPAPNPEPEPSPSPTPSPVVKKLTAADREALAASLTFTIESIDKGNVRTVQGARSTFKQSISAKASFCDDSGCRIKPEVSEVLDAWTEETDFTSLPALKASFEEFLKEVQK